MQLIEKISCKGFRGFKHEEELTLAQPNGKFGSGITVLIGPNGGGKSTIIEAFRKLTPVQATSFTEGKRNKAAGDKVSIKVTMNGVIGELRTVESGGSETEWVSANGNQPPKVCFLPSRRVFNPYFSHGGWDKGQYLQNTSAFQFRGQSLDQFSHRLFNAFENIDSFSEIFNRVYGKKLNWTIDQNDNGQYSVKINKDGDIFHNSDGLGEGIVSLLFLVDAIFESTPTEILVIDEPELSLHPQLQRRFLMELGNLSKDRQIVFATHSPEMISIDPIINGMEVARIVDDLEGSHIFRLNDRCRDTFKSLESDLFNPHTFGYESRSCLFAEDKIVIAEGQEDVVFFNKMNKDLELEFTLPFWGYGAGGSGKINKIASILASLGFKKVGAIFDGDKADEAEAFRQNFSNYGCWILPADDIRDKTAPDGNITKAGIFDSNKTIKPEYIESCKSLLNKVKAFLEIN